MALDLNKFTKQKELVFRRGNVKITESDMVANEIVTISTLESDDGSWEDQKGIVYTQDLVDYLKSQLSNYKAIVVKAR